MLKVRAAKPSDFDFVLRGVSTITQMCINSPDLPAIPGAAECYSAMLADPRHHHMVIAEDNSGTPLGVALFSMHLTMHFGGWSGELQDLYVVKEERCKGVGRALVKYLDDFATKNKLRFVTLSQPPPGSPLSEERSLFYKRCGYDYCSFFRQKRFNID
jgi:GNAT superfamily N-acetyltransferase